MTVVVVPVDLEDLKFFFKFLVVVVVDLELAVVGLLLFLILLICFIKSSPRTLWNNYAS